MSADVDPKNTRKRSSNNPSLSGWLRKLLPENFNARNIFLVFMIALASLMLYDFFTFVYSNSQYRTNVVITGLEKLNTEDVLKQLSTIDSSEPQQNLVDFSVRAVQSDIRESVPRLKDVQVRKKYPDRLAISVEEREPVALVGRVGGDSERVYLPIDREGVVFRPTPDEIESLPDKVPIVKGLESETLDSQSFDSKWRRILRVIEASRIVLTEDRIEWIKVRTGGYIELMIDRPTELTVRLGIGSYKQKLKKLRDMMQTEEFMNIEKYINLSDLDNIRVL